MYSWSINELHTITLIIYIFVHDLFPYYVENIYKHISVTIYKAYHILERKHPIDAHSDTYVRTKMHATLYDNLNYIYAFAQSWTPTRISHTPQNNLKPILDIAHTHAHIAILSFFHLPPTSQALLRKADVFKYDMWREGNSLMKSWMANRKMNWIIN